MTISNSAADKTDLNLLMFLKWKKHDLEGCLTWGSNDKDLSKMTPRLQRFRWTAEDR